MMTINSSTTHNRRNRAFAIVVAILVIGLAVGAGLFSMGKRGLGPLAGLATPTPTITITATPTRTSIPTITFTPLPGIGSTWTRPRDGMAMVYVPAGEFIMGMDADEALSICQQYRPDCQKDWFTDEEPVHTVYLDAYWIDQTEATNGMYASCVDSGACSPPVYLWSHTRSRYFGNPDYSNYPVIFVTWYDAAAYCEWAGARLPSEAEWEKAARGTDAYVYPWGNNDITCSLANFWPSYSTQGCVDDTTPVGSYPSGKSPYGAYDMAGNVWEWVADWYERDYYSSSPYSDPQGDIPGGTRVLRGGSWYYFEYGSRSTRRVGHGPSVIFYGIGFRCSSSFP